MVSKNTQINIISEANAKHNNTYEYLPIVEIKSKMYIDIICKNHGIFKQRIDHHLNGSGCPKCMGRNKNLSELVLQYKSIHGDRYDYSLVEYKNANTKLKIICKKHGIFNITSRQHLNGVNCLHCERERISYSQRKTTNEFITNANITHGDRYDYSLVEYIKATKPVNIICKKHGIFKQIPRTHINGSGCPICRESKGEREIRLFLVNNNITFFPQHKFSTCKNLRQLPFDFYLPNYNMCIEFHGEQHYINKPYFGGLSQLMYIKNNDEIKSNFCKIEKIKLITISYKDFHIIETLLRDHLLLL